MTLPVIGSSLFQSARGTTKSSRNAPEVALALAPVAAELEGEADAALSDGGAAVGAGVEGEQADSISAKPAKPINRRTGPPQSRPVAPRGSSENGPDVEFRRSRSHRSSSGWHCL